LVATRIKLTRTKPPLLPSRHFDRAATLLIADRELIANNNNFTMASANGYPVDGENKDLHRLGNLQINTGFSTQKSYWTWAIRTC
jgi:hypothetical protein